MSTRDRLNRRVTEALARAGALDRLGPSRAAILASLDTALQSAEQRLRDRAAGQVDLFGFPQGPEASPDEVTLGFAEVPEWSEEERLHGEKEALGLYPRGWMSYTNDSRSQRGGDGSGA